MRISIDRSRFFEALTLAVWFSLLGLGFYQHTATDRNWLFFLALFSVYFWPVCRDFAGALYRVLRVARAASKNRLPAGSNGPNCPPLDRV